MTISTRRKPARRSAAAAEIVQMTMRRRTFRRATSGSSSSSSGNIRASYHAVLDGHEPEPPFHDMFTCSVDRARLGSHRFIPRRGPVPPIRGRAFFQAERRSLPPGLLRVNENTASPVTGSTLRSTSRTRNQLSTGESILSAPAGQRTSQRSSPFANISRTHTFGIVCFCMGRSSRT